MGVSKPIAHCLRATPPPGAAHVERHLPHGHANTPWLTRFRLGEVAQHIGG